MISFLTKMVHSLLKKKLASTWTAPQKMDNKFRFATHPQGIWQFHNNWQINSKVSDCCHIGASLNIFIFFKVLQFKNIATIAIAAV